MHGNVVCQPKGSSGEGEGERAGIARVVQDELAAVWVAGGY